MYLFWLCYKLDDRVDVVIQRGGSLIQARMVSSMANLDDGDFTEGHQLDPKTAKLVPKDRIGKRLSPEEAAAILRLFEG
jgi:hypothetical protein